MDRWRSECLWLKTAEKLRVPVLGICLGMQVINVAAGGTLIQDIPSQRPNSQAHTGPGIGCQHEINVVEGTLLAKMAPSPVMSVTSSHHQAVDKLANGYRVSATAPDGVIEAIEAASGPCIVGVQWHPERCLDQPNWALKSFVKMCGEHACSGRSEVSGTGCPMSTVLNKMLDG
jgi:gamma-glutamyl-gamma-aminobutyrate hydrolase PuuD